MIVESLEGRRLFAASSVEAFQDPATGIVTVNNAFRVTIVDQGDGTIMVKDTTIPDNLRTRRVIEGATFFTGVTGVVVNGTAGDDVIQYNGLTVGATIFGGAGNDIIILSDNGSASSLVHAGEGDDTVGVGTGND